VGTKIRAGTRRRFAAYATAAPWLPPDAAATPGGGIARVSRLANAPRTLNEPECCRNSSFNVSGNGARPMSLPLVATTGVSRMDGVRRGGLAPGVRLPSERTLATALKISRTTVVAAYDALRDAGWFESRHGSGTWVRTGSQPVAIARSAARLAALSASPVLGLI